MYVCENLTTLSAITSIFGKGIWKNENVIFHLHEIRPHTRHTHTHTLTYILTTNYSIVIVCNDCNNNNNDNNYDNDNDKPRRSLLVYISYKLLWEFSMTISLYRYASYEQKSKKSICKHSYLHISAANVVHVIFYTNTLAIFILLCNKMT